MDAVIEKGIRETSRHGGSAVAYSSDGDADVEMGEQAKPVVVKTEGEKRGRKKGPVAANRKQDSADLFSAPQHFTANAKTPPKKKMSRIPKITEKVTLPSPSSLMSGLQNPAAAAMNPMSNPLIPNFGMNLYGFGNIPANMIPGMMNPMMNPMAMAMLQQAATASQAATNTSRDGGSDSAVTLDSELEEGEISPPDTPIKKEVDEEAVKKEEERRREEERLRREEKEREAEIARKKEKERLEKEQEKQRQEERKKLLLLSQERDRLKKLEEEREIERREKLEKSEKDKPKDPEKEKKKSKKEKKEKKKMKEKERQAKPDEPRLFAPTTPVLKIKPMEAPSTEVSTSTPKLVIKNIPKTPIVKEEPA